MLIIIIISSIVSNTIILFQNNKYKNLYKNISNAEFVATVISDEIRKEYKSVYTIKIESINKYSKYKNTKLIINIKEEGILKYGDKISFLGEYKKPQTARNKGGFDYSEYLKTIGVHGIVETSKNSIKIIKDNNIDVISSLANKCKNVMTKQCDEILKQENAKLLQGILLGQVTEMDEETITNFKDSSLYHMLAVSGAHVIYIIIACKFLLAQIPKRVANTITILVLIFFMFITGFSLSVVRACIMGIMLLGAEMFYRRSDFINNMSIALLLILIQNPYSIKSLSLLLSFGGTIGIVSYWGQVQSLPTCHTSDLSLKCQFGIVGTYLEKIKKYIKENLITTISAQLIVAPILLINFHTISLTFFISNVLAGIIIGPITILGFITIFLSFVSVKLAKLLAILLNMLLSTLKIIANLTSKIPFSNIYIISIPFVFIIIYYAVILIINLYKRIQIKDNKRITEMKFINRLQKINWRKIITVIIIITIIFNLLQFFTKKFTIHFIDVGQGDSCLIITETNKKILIDGGGSEFGSFDVGEKTLLPYLLNRRVRTLDCVMISHFDTDHCARDFNSYGRVRCESSCYIKARRKFRKLPRIFKDSKRKEYKSKTS